MDYVFHGVDKMYPVTLLNRLGELRSERYMVDVTLCVEEKEIPCHRLVLSAYSDYFHAMFKGAHSESKKDTIEIGGVSAEALQLLVDFAYTSKITITSDNVRPLLQAANMLQVSQIRKACEVFLGKQLRPDSCLGVWALADLVSSTTLSEMARGVALKSFEEVHTTEEFLQLPVDYLKTYLSDDGLHAKKEEQVLEAIMLWARHDLEERQKHLEKLMECVRFQYVNPSYLKNILKNDKVLEGVRGIKKLIRNQPVHVRPRNILQEEILVLGGETSWGEDDGEGINPNMYRLDLHSNCLNTSLLPVPLSQSKGLAACVLNNEVIVTGGEESLSQAWKYRPSKDSWIQLASLRNGRSYHGMASVNGQVYVVGGYNGGDIMPQPSVEVYSEKTNIWRKRRPLPEAVVDFGITTCQGKIYVFGGLSHFSDTNALQCYDPSINVWTFGMPLRKPMADIRACTVGSKIYLVGGPLKKVVRYNPEKGKTYYEELAGRLDLWDECGVTVCGSEIFITGGQAYDSTMPSDPMNSADNVATLQCYNTSNGTMIKGKDLPFKLRGHCTVTITKD